MLMLVAAVPLAALWWAFLRARREKALERLVASSLRARLMPPGANLWGLQAFFIVAGLALTLFSASRPQWGKSTEKVIERSRNVVVAIDVSRSMLAEDVRPNRLERVKADVADLIDSLEGDRCALVAFRGTGESSACYDLYLPVRNCKEMTLSVSFDEWSGYPFDEWYLYVRDLDGNWSHVAMFNMEDTLQPGEAKNFTFSFDPAISFDALSIAHVADGYQFNVSYSIGFFDIWLK